MGTGAVAVQNKPEIGQLNPIKKAVSAMLPPAAQAEKRPGYAEQAADLYRGALGVLAMVLNPMGLGVNPSASKGNGSELANMKVPERENSAKRAQEYKSELKKELAIRLVNARLGNPTGIATASTGDTKQLSQLTSMAGRNGSKNGSHA